LRRAAEKAVEWGSLDLDNEHLLWSAVDDDVVRRLLKEVGADPGSLKTQIEDVSKGGRTNVAPSLARGAKRALPT
jgi:ATP-dependent Clp protease ATP-binding subunit ClpC